MNNEQIEQAIKSLSEAIYKVLGAVHATAELSDHGHLNIVTRIHKILDESEAHLNNVKSALEPSSIKEIEPKTDNCLSEVIETPMEEGYYIFQMGGRTYMAELYFNTRNRELDIRSTYDSGWESLYGFVKQRGHEITHWYKVTVPPINNPKDETND